MPRTAQKNSFVLAIDQGTTSSRALLFDSAANIRATVSAPVTQIYPANGWVEHDAQEIWEGVLASAHALLEKTPARHIAAIGITNQRETSVVWDRKTGKPLHNAIVWQDRRGGARCAALKAQGLEPKIARRTGLLLDPYFSATKLEWLLKNVKGLRARAAKGEIAFGTIDSWLIYNLTGGRVHATDVTNASRTMLFDLKRRRWDDELLALFGVPRAMLPEVRESRGDFGVTDVKWFGAEIPILGVAGDQQAASFGQACFAPGDVKSTYGTGCFALVNTGKAIAPSTHRLLSTALPGSDYAVEGSIFVAGAVVQWLRDEMGLIASSAESASLAAKAAEAPGLYFVSAFTGLGAPYWQPEARGAIFGLTRDTGRAEIVRAALDAVCYQTRDLLEAMGRDMTRAKIKAPRALKVDGGMVANDWFCQRLADLTGLTVDRPKVIETTALGAAYLAGLGAGLFASTKEIATHWALDRRFVPKMRPAARDKLYEGWLDAVARILPRATR